MGYSSDFFVEETYPKLDADDIYEVAKALMETDGGTYFYNIGEAQNFLQGDGLYGVQWYDCMQDFITISKNFPDIAFAIKRVGEGSEVEGIYVLNGESECRTKQPNMDIPEPRSEKFRKVFQYPS